LDCLTIVNVRNYRDDSSEVLYCGRERDLRRVPGLREKMLEISERENTVMYSISRVHLDRFIIGNTQNPLELYVDQTLGSSFESLICTAAKPFSIPFNKNVRKSLIDFLEGLNLSDEA